MNKRIVNFILCLAFVLTLGGEYLLSLFSISAKAESISYSNVLDDLKKDKNFNIEDYPEKADDYSLNVIQIAESENGELFVYVYRPSNRTRDYKAKYINMSLHNRTDKALSYSLYSLSWVNSDGVFDKYIVNNFKVITTFFKTMFNCFSF